MHFDNYKFLRLILTFDNYCKFGFMKACLGHTKNNLTLKQLAFINISLSNSFDGIYTYFIERVVCDTTFGRALPFFFSFLHRDYTFM